MFEKLRNFINIVYISLYTNLNKTNKNEYFFIIFYYLSYESRKNASNTKPLLLNYFTVLSFYCNTS